MSDPEYVLFGLTLVPEMEGRVWASRFHCEGLSCDVSLIREGEKQWNTSLRVDTNVVLSNFGQTPEEAIKDIEPEVETLRDTLTALLSYMDRQKKKLQVQKAKEELGITVTTFHQIREVLLKADPDGHVIIERGTLPYKFQKEYWRGVNSYRGNYYHPAISFHEYLDLTRSSVKAVLEELESIEQGCSFSGWRGGEYYYSGYEGIIHIADRGESSRWIVDTVELLENGSVVIKGKEQ